jgi:hypothetical protein
MVESSFQEVKVIETVEDLADVICAEPNEKSIARRIYKATTCGCPAGIKDGQFWVMGYCEGSDWEHAVYELKFPFNEDELWKAIDKADKDGMETWDRTHGCEHCQTKDCKVEEVEGKGWRISWDDGESWWKGGGWWKSEADRNGSEEPITYRSEEWSIRYDFSTAMDEYGVVAINEDCKHCDGQGICI